MGVFERISRIIRSNISELLDKVEDPEKVLQQIILDMQQDLREAKLYVAAAIRDMRKLEAKYQENIDMAEKWEKRAISSVELGNDVIAKEALRRKRTYEDLANGYKAQLDEQTKSVQSLKTNLMALEAKIEDAKRRKDLIMARQKRAKAQKTISETMSGLSKSKSFSIFSKMEDKVRDDEVQAEAVAELESDSLENQFTKLDHDDIDSELAKLKAKIAEKNG